MGGKILSLVLVFVMVIPAFVPVESSEQQMEGRDVTFTKYLPDGGTEKFSMFVPYTGKDFSKDIADTCARMVKEDKAIQNFLNNTALKLYFIMSIGGGFHFAFPPSILKISLWSISMSLFPSAIYCNYHGSDSETDIIPIVPSGNSTTIYGEHKVITLGFIGIVGWDGLFTMSDTGFAGLTLFVWTSV